MIGALPTSIEVSGREYAIDSDFRPCLSIIRAFGDPALTNDDKTRVLFCVLYEDMPDDPGPALFPIVLSNVFDDVVEAQKKAVDFLNCGKQIKGSRDKPKLVDWSQDEQYIFSSINKKAGCSVRALPYLHWWDFMGYYLEPDESMLSHIISIRSKRSKGKPMEGHEKEFYEENREIIDFDYQPSELDAAFAEFWAQQAK